MGTFKSQQSAHNWLKQGKVISDICLGSVYYYKLVKGKLKCYSTRTSRWRTCTGELGDWFSPVGAHRDMRKSRLKDIPNYNKG